MSMYGADADALLAGAARMRDAADELDRHSAELSRTISSVSWIGQVASAFVSMWNGGHRRHLASTANFTRQMASKLEAHAKEQQQASEARSSGQTVQPAPSPTPPAPSVPGGLLPGANRTWQEVQRDYDANYVKYGLWASGGPNGEDRYQCVSWAWFRMRELGYFGDQVQGNGGELAGNLGGATSTTPQPGAVMSYPGHVFIAEKVEVLPDGRMKVTISEMNSGNDGSGWQEAHPSEYRLRTIEQNADGTWSSNGDNVVITTWNPPYPNR